EPFADVIRQHGALTLLGSAHQGVLGADQTSALVQLAEHMEAVPVNADYPQLRLDILAVEGFLAELGVGAQRAQAYLVGEPGVRAELLHVGAHAHFLVQLIDARIVHVPPVVQVGITRGQGAGEGRVVVGLGHYRARASENVLVIRASAFPSPDAISSVRQIRRDQQTSAEPPHPVPGHKLQYPSPASSRGGSPWLPTSVIISWSACISGACAASMATPATASMA